MRTIYLFHICSLRTDIKQLVVHVGGLSDIVLTSDGNFRTRLDEKLATSGFTHIFENKKIADPSFDSLFIFLYIDNKTCM